jgi:hypothetical protein
MGTIRRYDAVDEISRDDSRFKCRMCGKPIFGVPQSDKDYYSTFYCSRDCQQAHLFYCIVCANVLGFIPSGWTLAFLINGVPMSMQLLLFGFLTFFVILNFVGVYIAVSSWTIRQRIIGNRLLDSIETELEK